MHAGDTRAYIGRMQRRRVYLAAAVTLELAALSGIAMLGDLRAHLPAFLLLFGISSAAMFCAWRLARSLSLTFGAVALVAVALRVPMLFTEPSLSDDVWRYLHDGRAQLAGVSPYAFAPADARTARFRGEEHARINHPDLVTIYPPAAQVAFAFNAVLGSSLLGWRLLLIACELVLLAALLRLGAGSSNLVLYAWHPLAIIEAIGSAHLEPLGSALLLAALAAAAARRSRIAGVLIGTSIAVKFIAAPVLLVTAHARDRRILLTAAAATLGLYAFYWSDGAVFGSLSTFAVRWEANASLYAALAFLTDGHRARILAAALLLCVLVGLRASRFADIERATLFVLALLLLSPVVHPWYLLWLLALAPAVRSVPLRAVALVWSVTIVLAYVEWRVVEYVPVYAVLSAAALQHFRSRTSSPSRERTLQKST